MTLEIQILAWDRNKYVVGLNGVMVNQTYTTFVLLQTDNNEGKFRKYFILIRTQ
jgi:RNase P/RNase MRP subunit p29